MKKMNWKAAARKLGAMLMALVLIFAAITPAKQAYALEEGGGSFLGGILDALQSEQTPETEGASAEIEAPAFGFTFDEGKHSADTESSDSELPVWGGNVEEEAPTESGSIEEVGGIADILNAADLTIEQGSSGRYSLVSSRRYSYSISPSVSGLTATAGGYGDSAYVTVTASESVPAGIYTVTYTRAGYTPGTFTVEVTAPEDDGGNTGGSGTGTPEVEETQKMTMDKTATEILDANGNPTGAYDLTLSLSGSIGSQTNKAKVDVIFIVDNSNSMYPNYSTYMQSLRPAMQLLVTNLATTNAAKIDARFAIAMFGTNSSIRLNFSDSNGTAAYNSLGSISKYSNSQNGGTNYQGGIYQGKQLLGDVREGATSIVIFVTDGLPTYRGAPNMTHGNGQDDSAGNNIQAAVNEIDNMNCNYFYCIGIGDNFTNSSRTEYQNMSKLTAAVNADTTGIHSVSSNNVSALTGVFNNISAEVTSFLCSDVTITDTLSNVDGELMVEVSDPSSVMVEVIKDGTTIAGPAASVTLAATDKNVESTLTASYSNGVLKLDFPDAYQLEAGYTYKLHAVIEPTEKAYQEYRETGYTDTGAAGTGSHAGEEGFYCNEGATVTYTYKGEAGTAQYPHPVIQLHPADLKITKQIVNMDVSVIETLEFPMTLVGPDGTEQTNTILLSEFDYDEETGIYSMLLEDLSPNTTYAITENGGEVSGYTIETTVNGAAGKDANGTLEMDETEVVAYVNKYVKTDQDLEEGEGTITISGEKLWVDDDNASGLRPETLSVTLQGCTDLENDVWEDIQTVTVTPDASGKWTFSMDVSSYSYLAYRFEEAVPKYYEVTYQQPTYEFTYPDAGEWANETSCSELNISKSEDAKTIVVSKKGSDFYIWSYDALTAGEQKLIMDSFVNVDKSFKPENTTFFYGIGSSVLGMTVTEDKISYLNPNKWSYVYVGTYSRGSESVTSGIITNELAATDVVISKEVGGNMGILDMEFEFTATLSTGVFAEGQGYTLSDDGKTATFSLMHGEQITLNGVPLGAELTVTESNGVYVVTVTAGQDTYQNGAAIEVTPELNINFYNYYDVPVDTGVAMDSIPYVMILFVAASAIFFVMMRKRISFED